MRARRRWTRNRKLPRPTIRARLRLRASERAPKHRGGFNTGDLAEGPPSKKASKKRPLGARRTRFTTLTSFLALPSASPDLPPFFLVLLVPPPLSLSLSFSRFFLLFSPLPFSFSLLFFLLLASTSRRQLSLRFVTFPRVARFAKSRDRCVCNLRRSAGTANRRRIVGNQLAGITRRQERGDHASERKTEYRDFTAPESNVPFLPRPSPLRAHLKVARTRSHLPRSTINKHDIPFIPDIPPRTNAT